MQMMKPPPAGPGPLPRPTRVIPDSPTESDILKFAKRARKIAKVMSRLSQEMAETYTTATLRGCKEKPLDLLYEAIEKAQKNPKFLTRKQILDIYYKNE